MPDILDEAAHVANDAEREMLAKRIAEILVASPTALFSFMVADVENQPPLVQQWTNTDPRQLLWLLSAVAHATMRDMGGGDFGGGCGGGFGG